MAHRLAIAQLCPVCHAQRTITCNITEQHIDEVLTPQECKHPDVCWADGAAYAQTRMEERKPL